MSLSVAESPEPGSRTKQPPQLVVSFGLDVHRDDFVASYRRSDAEPFQSTDIRKMKSKKFPRTLEGSQDLLQWAMPELPDQARLLIVMEATGTYSLQLALWLEQLRPGVRPVIIDPSRVKKYAGSTGMRNKTDKIDARVIACYGAERRPVGDEPPEQIYRDIRALGRTRLALMDHMQAIRNQRDSLCPDDMSSAVAKVITQGFAQSEAHLQKQIEKIEAQTRLLVAGDESVRNDIKQLESVVGVGFITAAAVLGEFGDLRRFATARQLTAFAGLNPEIKDSGKKQGQAHISKRGTTYGRRSLYMSAVSAIKCDCEMAHFYHRLVQENHKPKMVALVALMRKMLITMRSVIITNEKYDRHYKANNVTSPMTVNPSPTAQPTCE